MEDAIDDGTVVMHIDGVNSPEGRTCRRCEMNWIFCLFYSEPITKMQIAECTSKN